MQTRALLLFLGTVEAAKSTPPAHDWLSPSRSMVTVVAVERQCPGPDFELVNNDLCVKTLEVPAESTCSRSSAQLQEDNKTCVTTEFFPPERVCPANAVFNGEQCDKFEVQSAASECEQGDELVNGECWHYDQRVAQLSCPKNYQIKGDRCVFSTSTTPDLVCPPEYRRNSVDTCVKTTVKAVQPDCPEGTQFTNGVCVSEAGLAVARSANGDTNVAAVADAVLPVSKRCMSGGEIDEHGRCVSVTSVEADIICPAGYAMNGGRCDRPVSTPASYRCPSNFVLQGDVCVQTLPAEPYCHGERETLTTTGTCISLHSEPPIRSCPQRSAMSPDGRCAVQVIHEHDLELYCDPTAAGSSARRTLGLTAPTSSYQLVNEMCVKVVKNYNVMVCAPGYTFTQNQCVATQTAAPKPECRSSTYDPISGQCVTVTAVDQLVQCPKGFEIDSRTRTCRSKKVYHPQMQCPENYVLKRKRGASKESYECQQHTTVAAESTCGEQGELENGKCVHRLVSEAIQVCPEGLTVHEGVCQQRIETFASKTCPPDFKQVGNACVGKVPTETQTLTNEDRRLLIDALQGFGKKSNSPTVGGNSSSPRKNAGQILTGASWTDSGSPIVTTNDQDLLSMAEILTKWQQRSKPASNRQ